MASEASRLHLLIRDAGLSVPQQLPDPVVTDFSCDSRRIRPGTLFVGLPGERVDGGSFWRAALQQGATAAVIGPMRPSRNHRLLVIRCWWWPILWRRPLAAWLQRFGITPAIRCR